MTITSVTKVKIIFPITIIPDIRKSEEVVKKMVEEVLNG
jgi:hypothetical protein